MHILMHIFEKCWMSTFEEQKSFWKRNSLIIRLKIETSISNLMLNIEFSRVVISSALAYRRTHCCNIAYADFISSSDQITSHKDSVVFFDSNFSSQNWNDFSNRVDFSIKLSNGFIYYALMFKKYNLPFSVR